MAYDPLESARKIADREDISRLADITKQHKYLKMESDLLSAEQAKNVRKMSTFSLFMGDTSSKILGKNIKDASDQFAEAMAKVAKGAGSLEEKFKNLTDAAAKKQNLDRAEAIKEQLLKRRQAFVGGVAGMVGGIGEIIHSSTDFIVKRQQQRHESSKFINDMYLSGMHAMRNWDYTGMMKAAAYMSPEAAEYGRRVGAMDQAGRIITAGAKVGANVVGTLVAGSISPVTGIAMGAMATSNIVDIMSGATFDSATISRESRSRYAETMYQRNRMRWEQIEGPKFGAFATLGMAQYARGQSGAMGWAQDEPYHPNSLEYLKKTGSPSPIETQEELRFIHRNRLMMERDATKRRVRGNKNEDLWIARVGGGISEWVSDIWHGGSLVDKIDQKIFAVDNQISKAEESKYSNLIGNYSWITGFNQEKAIQEAVSGAGYAGGNYRSAHKSVLAAMSRGVIASGKQYADISAGLGIFTPNAQNASDMFLGQLVGKSTPEITSEIAKSASSVGAYAASRGLDVGTAPSTLMLSAMSNRDQKKYTTYDINRARTAIEDVDRRLTSGKLDMGKVIASASLSKAGIGGEFQQALFTLSSTEIMELQKSANQGEEQFKETAGRLRIYGISRKQWLSNNISGTLTTAAYSTAGIVLGLSPEAMSLLGSEGYLDNEQRQEIFKGLSEKEKALITTVTGRRGGIFEAVAGITGGGKGGEGSGGISSQGMGLEALRKIAADKTKPKEERDFAEYLLTQGEQQKGLTEGSTFGSILDKTLSFTKKAFGVGAAEEVEKLAQRAGGETFGFVKVNNMEVTRMLDKTGR